MRKLPIVGVVILLAVCLVFTLSLTAVSAAVACPGAPAPRLAVGNVARPAQVFSSLRQALDSNVVITVMRRANNDTFTVLAGPNCGSGPHNWYQVNFKGTVGWVTEGTSSTYWVEVVPPSAPTPTPKPPTPTPAPSAPHVGACLGAPAPRLVIGKTARPAQVFSSLRPALDSNVVIKVLYRANGDTFSVTNGPFCGTGPHNWWQVNHGGTVGWVTEGAGSTYWVEPIP